jgi:hypothetical protein
MEVFTLGMGLIGLLLFPLIFLTVLMIVDIFFLVTLQRTLGRCAPHNRTMSPPLVWLLLIPTFELVWQFLVVLAIANSLDNEFRERGMIEEAKPGQSLGLAMCIIQVAFIIPFAVIFLAIPYVVVLIFYWSKIAGYAGQLENPPQLQRSYDRPRQGPRPVVVRVQQETPYFAQATPMRSEPQRATDAVVDIASFALPQTWAPDPPLQASGPARGAQVDDDVDITFLESETETTAPPTSIAVAPVPAGPAVGAVQSPDSSFCRQCGGAKDDMGDVFCRRCGSRY